MKIESIAECSLGAFCNTFDLHYAIIGLENQFLIFFLSGRLRQVLLYLTTTVTYTSAASKVNVSPISRREFSLRPLRTQLSLPWVGGSLCRPCLDDFRRTRQRTCTSHNSPNYLLVSHASLHTLCRERFSMWQSLARINQTLPISYRID